MANLSQPSSTRSSARESARPADPVGPARPGRRARHRSRGQSLAEFALTFPMALLMILFGLDFGRVFLGWVALNSAAREAANYAAMNPEAWTIPYNLEVVAEYERLVETEASNINCDLTSPIASPTFPSGTSIGAPASVVLTCQFGLITPFLGLIMGNPIPVSASSAFPVRSGLIESVPLEAVVPTATASPAPGSSEGPGESTAPGGSSAPGETSTPTVDPGASAPAPTAAPSPTPSPTPPTCTVVSLLNTVSNKVATKWQAAGFTGAVIFSPLVPPNYKVAWQSRTVGGMPIPCTSGIEVRSSAP